MRQIAIISIAVALVFSVFMVTKEYGSYKTDITAAYWPHVRNNAVVQHFQFLRSNSNVTLSYLPDETENTFLGHFEYGISFEAHSVNFLMLNQEHDTSKICKLSFLNYLARRTMLLSTQKITWSEAKLDAIPSELLILE